MKVADKPVMQTKVICISDLHGLLPEIPECDILIIGGDICPATNHSISFQSHWLNHDFAEWLESIPAKHVIGIAGNHDLIFEKQPELVPASLKWKYLQDSSIEIEGFKIYGTPWQIFFCDWAFNAPEEDDQEVFLAQKYSQIPLDTDIIISHGPPFGYGDMTRNGTTTGSQALLSRIRKVCPKLVVTGHIHEAHGEYGLILDRNNTGHYIPIINASLLDDRYRHVYPHIEFSLSDIR